MQFYRYFARTNDVRIILNSGTLNVSLRALVRTISPGSWDRISLVRFGTQRIAIGVTILAGTWLPGATTGVYHNTC